ncbi:GIY-YIG nuclease family protein [Pedobacter sp. UBA5917]|uniref:GIY-YIG nuclease family protein n=1 Tax=Pedobacter sp. UBA5917 TaxID=1947061 RepID=UPI003BEEB052
MIDTETSSILCSEKLIVYLNKSRHPELVSGSIQRKHLSQPNHGARWLRLHFNQSYPHRPVYWSNLRIVFQNSRAQKKGTPNSFTAKYNCNKLVYYEQFDSIEEAIAKEKQLKNWKRAWKINLINESNPNWEDLFDTIEED